MRFKILFLFFILSFFLSAAPVSALQCSLNGVEYECPGLPSCYSDALQDAVDQGNCTLVNSRPDPFPPGTDPKTDINSCCRLRYTIKFEGITFPKGCVVGAHKDDKGAYCLINGKNVTDEINTFKTENNGTGDPCAAARPLAAYKKWGMVCLLNTVHSITNWTFYIMMTIAVFLVALAGYYHMTALGDPEKASNARNLIWYSIIGLLLGLLAYFIPAMVMMAAR